MSTVKRKFYYYSLSLCKYDETNNIVYEYDEPGKKALQIFKEIKKIQTEIEKEDDESKRKILQSKLEVETENGDKLYVIVDGINEDQGNAYKNGEIAFRLVLCRKDALPYVESAGMLKFLSEYLPKDFSLAEITHCILFINTGVMGAEFNYAGARPSSLAEYLMTISKNVDFAKCVGLINNFAFEKVKSGKEYSLFELSVKNTPYMKAELLKQKGIFSALICQVDNVDEYTISFKRRITKKKKGFNAPMTEEEMKNFIKKYKDYIGKFKISQGTYSDAIDLLKDKLVCTSELTVKTENKMIDSGEAYREIQSFYYSDVKTYLNRKE